MEFLFLLFFIVLFAVIALGIIRLRLVTVFEYEQVLIFADGKFQRVLGPGAYWLSTYNKTLRRVDMRQQYVTLPGQEVLTSDNAAIRISLVASYQVVDPRKALTVTANLQEALYLQIQLQARDFIGAAEVEQLLTKRQELAGLLLEACAPKAEELGLKLLMVSLKDITFPPDLRMAFAQVLNARKQGLAALERARGETAALRSLANAAQMLKDHPELYRLRLLQVLEHSSGNTVVLNGSSEDAALIQPRKPSA